MADGGVQPVERFLLRCRRFGAGFFGGGPIHHLGGNFLPGGALDAVVADAVALPLVLAHNLEAAVGQDQFLAARQGSGISPAGSLAVSAGVSFR